MTLFVALDRPAATLFRKSFKLSQDRQAARLELYSGEVGYRPAALVLLRSREPDVEIGYAVGLLNGRREESEPFYTLALLTDETLDADDGELCLYDQLLDEGSGRRSYPDIVINPGLPQKSVRVQPDASGETLRAVMSAERLLLEPHSYDLLGLSPGTKLSLGAQQRIAELVDAHAALTEEYREPIGEGDRALLERIADTLGLSRVQRDRLYYEAEARTIREREFPRQLLERYAELEGRGDRKRQFTELTESLRS